MIHKIKVKVYYEDTDCLGVVYHANYLKYLERGRSEYIEHIGKPIREWNRAGFNFVVYEMKISFKKAAVLGDILDISTEFKPDSDYRGKFYQNITRKGELIVEAKVDIVCLNEKKELKELPDDFKKII